MRKGRDGEKKKKTGKKEENTDENSGHYVIASSRLLECRPLERRTLVPKVQQNDNHYSRGNKKLLSSHLLYLFRLCVAWSNLGNLLNKILS